MTIAMESKYDGTIRFYREPKRAGGELLAVFPSRGILSSRRDAYSVQDGYVEVPKAYVRTLRPVAESDGHARATADRMLEQIDQRAEYVRSLMRPID